MALDVSGHERKTRGWGRSEATKRCEYPARSSEEQSDELTKDADIFLVLKNDVQR